MTSENTLYREQDQRLITSFLQGQCNPEKPRDAMWRVLQEKRAARAKAKELKRRYR